MPGFLLPVYDLINDSSLFSRGFAEVYAGGFNALVPHSSEDIRQLTNEVMETANQFAQRKGVVFA